MYRPNYDGWTSLFESGLKPLLKMQAGFGRHIDDPGPPDFDGILVVLAIGTGHRSPTCSTPLSLSCPQEGVSGIGQAREADLDGQGQH